jgi:protocatechuate 3,4-dioxygenase, beta subunit
VLNRQFLRQAAFTAALFTTPGLFADLIQTPRQTEGPFYPDKLPLDTDNDLLVINEATTPALGEIAYVSGRVLDAKGEPIRDAVVEIWQCDRNGAYLHSGTDNREKNDKNFQGFGRFVTGSTGEYLFRTIRPVPYPGRTPHIHYKVKRGGKELLVTQLYVKGHPGNERDGIWRNLKGAQRDAVTVDFVPMPKSKAGELAAKFDLVLGFTPAG